MLFVISLERTVYAAEIQPVKGENASISKSVGESKSNLSRSSSTDKVYSIEEISKHKTKETGIWMTYKMGVYDVTDWVDDHPGGEIIMAAAGNAMDPYWNVYSFHKDEAIEELLENYRIGKVYSRYQG